MLTAHIVVSIPIRLLWNLQIPLRKKIILGIMLSLSAVMIVVAIIRTALAPLPNGVIDTSWLVFWTGMEAMVAIIMVSLTAFRSLFHGEDSSYGRKKGSGNSGGSWGFGRGGTIREGVTRTGESTGKRKRLSMYGEESVPLRAVSSPTRSWQRREVWDTEARQETAEVAAMTTTTGAGKSF